MFASVTAKAVVATSVLLVPDACVVAVVAVLIVPFKSPLNVVAVEVPLIVTELGNPIVTILPVALVSISLDVPATVNVSLSRSIAIVPLSVVISKSSAVICVST